MNRSLAQRLDHLVYATNDLDASAAALERLLGVRPSPGGQHLGRGTRNALIALGPTCYFEIIGPDPAQPAPATPRWFGIDRLTAPKLVGWAVNTGDLNEIRDLAARQGVQLGAVTTGSRQRADGVTLTWAFTDPTVVVGDGLVPFFIDWGMSPHPAASAARGVELVAFSAEHPDPNRIREILGALRIDLEVNHGSTPALIVTIRTATGQVQIR